MPLHAVPVLFVLSVAWRTSHAMPSKIEGPKGRAQNSRADAQESELSKENMRGIGNERQSRQGPSIDEDQGLGR